MIPQSHSKRLARWNEHSCNLMPVVSVFLAAFCLFVYVFGVLLVSLSLSLFSSFLSLRFPLVFSSDPDRSFFHALSVFFVLRFSLFLARIDSMTKARHIDRNTETE